MERICCFKKTEKGTEIYLNGCLAGLAEAAQQAEDTFVMVEDGVVCWKRTVDTPIENMTMRFITSYPSRYQMVPALQYDENNCFYIKDYEDVRNAALPEEKREKHKTPTYFIGNRDPETGEPWRFIWHRASIPGATYSEGETLSVGMFLPPRPIGWSLFSLYRGRAYCPCATLARTGQPPEKFFRPGKACKKAGTAVFIPGDAGLFTRIRTKGSMA